MGSSIGPYRVVFNSPYKQKEDFYHPGDQDSLGDIAFEEEIWLSIIQNKGNHRLFTIVDNPNLDFSKYRFSKIIGTSFMRILSLFLKMSPEFDRAPLAFSQSMNHFA